MSASSDRPLARLFSRAGHPIFVLDPAYNRIRYANQSACALLGYAVDELLAMAASTIFRAERVGLKAFLEAIKEEGDGWTTSFAVRTKTAGLLSAELLALAFHSDGHRYVLVLAKDRTQQEVHPD